MLLAFDAHYRLTTTRLACVAFRDWTDPAPAYTAVYDSGPAAAYEPGKFYKRELPLIVEALHQFDLADVRAIVVDGYVTLDGEGRKGLGQYLFEALKGRTAVIGVAKSYFRDTHAEVLLRGQSTKPLYVTAAGMPDWQAAESIRRMAGNYRMPELLREVDRLSKTE